MTGSRPYTRSVLHLLRSLSLLGREPDENAAMCAKLLSEQHVGARYPDARLLEYDRDDAETCLKCLEAVLHAV